MIATSVKCWMCQFWLSGESETKDRWSNIGSSATQAKVGVCAIQKEAGIKAPHRWTAADSTCSTPLMKVGATAHGFFRTTEKR